MLCRMDCRSTQPFTDLNAQEWALDMGARKNFCLEEDM